MDLLESGNGVVGEAGLAVQDDGVRDEAFGFQVGSGFEFFEK